MQAITLLIKQDMVPALGVTEPGAIAFAAAKAKTLMPGALRHITVSMNSGLYKNACACGIPNTDEVGSAFAAALGYVAGNADHGLEALNGTNDRDAAEAEQAQDSEYTLIQSLTLHDMIAYADSVPLREIPFVRDAHQMNLALFREGLSSGKTTFVRQLLKSADLAMAGVYVNSVHGINGRTPEETMQNIGRIASPGMTQTEKTIVDIQQSKEYTETKKMKETAP